MYGERDQRASGVSGQKQSSFKTFAFILLYFDRLLGLLSSTRGYLNLIEKGNLQRIDGCTVQSLAVALTFRSQLIYIFSPLAEIDDCSFSLNNQRSDPAPMCGDVKAYKIDPQNLPSPGQYNYNS